MSKSQEDPFLAQVQVEDLAKNRGKRYACEKCGAIVVYDSDCNCTVCDLICCGVPMKVKK